MSSVASTFFEVPAPALPPLVNAAPGDGFFPDLEPQAVEAIEARERAGEFTGERLFRQRPGTYMEVVRMLGGSGLGVKAIARRLGVSVNTVRAVRMREGAAVDTQREKTVAHLADFVELAAGRLADEAGEMPLAQLAVPLGIAVEKMQLLSGGATARVEIIQVPPVDAFNAMLAAMPVAVETGLSAGAALQKERAGEGVVVLGEAGRDSESPIFGAVEPDFQRDATPLATPDGGDPGCGGGGRGSASEPPPPIKLIDSAAREPGTNTDSCQPLPPSTP